ncbi:MAG: hypothetical protein FJX89_06065 [Bacteroidetes bacterium]|nr:hypothetical protein [Bacteroidota bacterium]
MRGFHSAKITEYGQDITFDMSTSFRKMSILIGMVLMCMGTAMLAYRFRKPLKLRFRHAWESIDVFAGGLSASCPGCESKFPDVVAVQENAYRSGRIRPQETMDDLDRLRRKGVLVELEDNDRYVIGEMDHSRPYVLPVVKAFLDELSRAYADLLQVRKLDYRPFVIISATRSIDTAEELTEENPIARRRSHHLFGKTIDISYKRFGRHESEKICLIEVLSTLRREGRCYVKYEKRGSLHLTVR